MRPRWWRRRAHASATPTRFSQRRRSRWASRRSSAETPSRRRRGTKRRPTAAAEKCSHKRGDGREVAHKVAGGSNSSPMDCPPTALGSGGRSYRGHLSRVASRAGAGRRSRWREGGAGCSGAPRAAANNSRVEWRASGGSGDTRGRDRGWLGEYCVYASMPRGGDGSRGREGGVRSATPAALLSLCPT